MIDCVRIQAGPCSIIKIDRGTMEIETKGEDVDVVYPMPEDLVDFFNGEEFVSMPANFGKRDPKTTIRLEIKCKVCTVKISAHPSQLVSHVSGKHHLKTLEEWKKLGKDKEAKQCGRGPNASPSSGRIARRHPSVYARASPYDRPSTSAARSYTGYNRQLVNSPSRASFAYDRPGASYDYGRPGPSHDRREEGLSRMSSDSSSGSDDNPRTCGSYAEFQAMKAAMKAAKK